MLSSVLRTQSAIQVNISIMRAFTAMRHFITSNTQVHRRLVNLELQQAEFATHQAEIDHKLEEVFRKLDDEHIIKRQGVFFDGQGFDAYKLTCQMIKNAKTHIILFDNYIDEYHLGASVKDLGKKWFAFNHM